jgi:hypothetical protein
MRLLALGSLAAIASMTAAFAQGGAHTRITVWSAAPAPGAYGGLAYGGFAPPKGATVTQQHEVEVGASGEVRIANVASTLDPASVLVRDLTDTSATIAEQRFTAGAATPTSVIAEPVKLAAGQDVQVPLVPPQKKATAKTVVLYEAIPDLSAGFQGYANTDCTQYSANTGPGTAEVAVEIAVPTKEPLPPGRVRMFRRKGDRVEVVSEEQLRSRAGAARIRLDRSTDVVGDRKAMSCINDEQKRTLTERIELKLENKSKRALDIVVREFAWRWLLFRIDAEDLKSARGGSQTLEYRVALPPGGKRTFSYTVVYTW